MRYCRSPHLELAPGYNMQIVRRVLVTGAGGFIGHHLVRDLTERGFWVRGVDLELPEYEPSAANEFQIGDLRRWEDAVAACEGVEAVYALAADMGGMGFISAHHAQILHNNSLINLNTLEAARQAGCQPLSLHILGMRLSRVSPERDKYRPAARRGRLPGAAPGCLRLGKTPHRATVHPLPRRLRPADAHCALPQHLRSARHLGGWT